MNTLDGVNIIGLTGQSGAGKTTVSALFKDFGFSVINCDKIARRVSDFPEFLSEMKLAFPDCVGESGLLRQKLGALVFNNHDALRRYGRIIFPYIAADIFSDIRSLRAQNVRLIILDAPTLFESGFDSVCSAVISVVAPFDIKLKRILERDGIPVELARSRLSSQFSEKFFSDRSDFLIVNDGSADDLKEKAVRTVSELKERFDV